VSAEDIIYDYQDTGNASRIVDTGMNELDDDSLPQLAADPTYIITIDGSAGGIVKSSGTEVTVNPSGTGSVLITD
jgi:hypothetical protein